MNNQLTYQQRHVHVGPQTVHTHSIGKGVVGVVEANFLHPTHNKQDFVVTSGTENKYGMFIQGLGEKLKTFWNDCNIDVSRGGVGIGEFFRNLWKKSSESRFHLSNTFYL